VTTPRKASGSRLLRLFRELVAASIRWTGLAFLVRATIGRNRVSIIVYHDPSPDVLERHLSYLARTRSLISLSELVDALHSGSWPSLPRHAVVITFDDGRRNNARLLDLFVRHGVTPTIFLCSQIVATNRHFWFLEIDNSEELKGLSNHERLEILEQAGFSPAREYRDEERHALSSEELARMAGHVEFGGHTRWHPVLTRCSAAECEEEIMGAKREIEELVGRECRHFAYPNGDYGEREIELLRQAGYLSGRTLDVGWNGPNTDPFRLKMLGTIDRASVNRLAADLSGIPGYLSRLREGSIRGRHRPARRRPLARRKPALDGSASVLE
jgi:peptidoglycan/xylan/chitin deacetylase (PgdA/CDA1 family)